MQLLVTSPEKFLCVIWHLGTKTYPQFVKLRSFFKIIEKKFQKRKTNDKTQIDSKKTSLFEIKKDRFLLYREMLKF